MRSASHPVAGQTLDQAEDGAVEDVGDHAAVVRLFLLLGTKQELSWNGHSRMEHIIIIMVTPPYRNLQS